MSGYDSHTVLVSLIISLLVLLDLRWDLMTTRKTLNIIILNTCMLKFVAVVLCNRNKLFCRNSCKIFLQKLTKRRSSVVNNVYVFFCCLQL